MLRFKVLLVMVGLTWLVGCQLESKSSATPLSIYDPEAQGEDKNSSAQSDIDVYFGQQGNDFGQGSDIAGNEDAGGSDIGTGGDMPAADRPSTDYDCETTEVFSEKMVCLHNKSRAAAKDPVPNPKLPPVTWNDDLAQIAANYAAKCIWDHNDKRSDNFPGYVGENIQVQSWQGNHAENSIKGWVDDEIPYYDYDTNSCQSGQQCGHYTQVVWRSSVEIGCAVQYCPTMQGIGISPAYFTVCNYAPGGNYNGQRPY